MTGKLSRFLKGQAKNLFYFLLSLLFSAGTGLVIFLLWSTIGLPSEGIRGDAPFPGLWRWFFSLSLPLLFSTFTGMHILLSNRFDGKPISSRGLRWDLISYILFILFIPLMYFGKIWCLWRYILAAYFLAVLFLKIFWLVIACYRKLFPSSPQEESNPPDSLFHLFIIPFLLYAFLTPYVITSVSTTGDEQLYLLNTESLKSDGDLDISNNVRQKDYEKFYWGRPSPANWTLQFLGFPALLLPGYALADTLLPHYPLAGRLGATLILNLLAALLCLQIYQLCREVGCSRSAAFWAWIIIAFSPPFLINSSHIYPEIPTALAVIVAIRFILRIPQKAWTNLALILCLVLFIIALKDRYSPLGLGLTVWALIQLPARRLLFIFFLSIVLVLSGFFFFWVYHPLPFFFHNLGTLSQVKDALLAWNRHMGRAFLGLWVDQQFGLLYYGPHWILAFIGLPMLWKRNKRVTIGLLSLILFYLLILVKYRWLQWDAGWTPPPRFILPVAPLLLPFIAELFDRCQNRGLVLTNSFFLFWNFFLVASLCLVPFWRYNDLTGRATLLQLLGKKLGLDLARFIPSLRAPTFFTWIEMIAGGILLLILVFYFSSHPVIPKKNWRPKEAMAKPLYTLELASAVFFVWIMAAAIVPTWSIEAEAMHHSGGIRFGSYQNQEILWVIKEDGEISEPIVTWPGLTEIRIQAAGNSTTGKQPLMELFLGQNPAGRWKVQAGMGRWTEGTYTARLQTGFGHPTLCLRFTNLLNKRSKNLMQIVYVDRISIRRAR